MVTVFEIMKNRERERERGGGGRVARQTDKQIHRQGWDRERQAHTQKDKHDVKSDDAFLQSEQSERKKIEKINCAGGLTMKTVLLAGKQTEMSPSVSLSSSVREASGIQRKRSIEDRPGLLTTARSAV